MHVGTKSGLWKFKYNSNHFIPFYSSYILHYCVNMISIVPRNEGLWSLLAK